MCHLFPNPETNTSGSEYPVGNGGRLRHNLEGHAGKRGRVVELSTNAMTPEYIGQDKKHFENTDRISNVITAKNESNVVNLFGIGAKKDKGDREETKPFIHQVRFHGPQGEVVRVWANIDNSTMKEVMSTTMFKKVKHRLGTSKPSNQLLRVANGVVVQSEARWEGTIEVDGVSATVAFEVFDSGGKWDFLFGKTLLETFRAVHDYKTDEIIVHGKGGETTLYNQLHIRDQSHPTPTTLAPICVISNDTQPERDEENAELEINIDVFKGNNCQGTHLRYIPLLLSYIFTSISPCSHICLLLFGYYLTSSCCQ